MTENDNILYFDLRLFFVDFLEKYKDEPVPLFWQSGAVVSKDVRTGIKIAIAEIDQDINKHPDEPKKMRMARIRKPQLIEIKKAIEAGQHDISKFGYTIADKWRNLEI